MAKPMKTLELHYPMIQFLIRSIIPCSEDIVSVHVIFWSVSIFILFSTVFNICLIYTWGVCNKTIIPLALVGYEIIIANSVYTISYPTHACRIIF